ncbi:MULTISPECIES: response regulator [unclassified Bradyrhizobium]|uniref:response regulator n=1 Tax=unclassified Bradyrhizobium TaxID=2631580 RepID=UPI00247B027C|nr:MULTISPECIES: response regulator [unclassified Bradyrhizobium]WGS24052.1 response regulator [Bradyrhizobium sp. ISRA463]WGS31363.1 response regulator [Bradyrhizobium sp. ISRA464]
MVRILYIEDNEDNIYMVSRRLRRKGYDVVVACDGAEGIALAKSQLPDLILMDLGLPVVDGWEVTRRLRAAPETAAIPVVALSAHALPEDRERALASGCNDFITKPTNFLHLLDRIEALVKRAPDR